MADPPVLNHIPTSTEKLKELFDQHKFEEKLLKYKPIRIPIKQNPMHEQFCCTGETIFYIDPDLDQEVVRIAEYTYRDRAKPKSRLILLLRIDNNVYKLELD